MGNNGVRWKILNIVKEIAVQWNQFTVPPSKEVSAPLDHPDFSEKEILLSVTTATWSKPLFA